MATFDAVYTLDRGAAYFYDNGHNYAGHGGIQPQDTGILLGHNVKFVISATGAFYLRLSVTASDSATGSDQWFPNGFVGVWDMGRAHEYVQVYNNSGAAIFVYITVLV